MLKAIQLLSIGTKLDDMDMERTRVFAFFSLTR